jgi:2-keto-4-pentenoate hydratase
MAALVSAQPQSHANRARRAAKMLLAARQSGVRLHALPEDVRPTTIAEAYAIQDEVASAIGTIGGWKVGAKSPTAEPTCAPLPAKLVLASPQSFPAGTFALNGVEAELAFTVARDLPPRSAPYYEAEMSAAMASVHPAIEVVDSRFVDLANTDALSVLADFQSHGALVIGAGSAVPDSLTFDEQVVRLDSDGVRVIDARDSNPAGHLARLLAWLANHAAARRDGLRRGDVITTGSWTGMRFCSPGTHVHADFTGIGGVDVNF